MNNLCNIITTLFTSWRWNLSLIFMNLCKGELVMMIISVRTEANLYDWRVIFLLSLRILIFPVNSISIKIYLEPISISLAQAHTSTASLMRLCADACDLNILSQHAGILIMLDVPLTTTTFITSLPRKLNYLHSVYTLEHLANINF